MTPLMRLSGNRQPSPTHDSGFSLPEAMVSSLIFMVVASQSASLFGHSLGALGKARLRDGINAAIAADLENVRHEVFTWAADTTPSADGQLSYTPVAAACSNGTLATQLLADRSSALPAQSSFTPGSSSSPLPNVNITRSISVDPADANVLLVHYTTANGSLVSVQQTTALVPPAQGWCP